MPPDRDQAAACNCGGNHSAIVGFDGPGNGHAVTCPVRTAASTDSGGLRSRLRGQPAGSQASPPDASAAYTPPVGMKSLERKLMHNGERGADYFEPEWAEVRIVMRERNRCREALERVLPLVVALSERGWIKGAEATEIIREALGDAE